MKYINFKYNYNNCLKSNVFFIIRIYNSENFNYYKKDDEYSIRLQNCHLFNAKCIYVKVSEIHNNIEVVMNGFGYDEKDTRDLMEKYYNFDWEDKMYMIIGLKRL